MQVDLARDAAKEIKSKVAAGAGSRLSKGRQVHLYLLLALTTGMLCKMLHNPIFASHVLERNKSVRKEPVEELDRQGRRQTTYVEVRAALEVTM